MAIAEQVGAGWGWLLASGIAGIVIGLFALAWPVPATYAAVLVAAALFLAAGVIGLVAGIRAPDHGRRAFLIGYGLLAIVAGALMLFFPWSGALALTAIVTAWLAARGILEIVVGARAPGRRWPWVVLGIVNVVLALFVWFGLPWAALTLPGVLLGVSFLLGGSAETVAALHHRRGAPALSLRG